MKATQKLRNDGQWEWFWAHNHSHCPCGRKPEIRPRLYQPLQNLGPERVKVKAEAVLFMTFTIFCAFDWGEPYKVFPVTKDEHDSLQ